MNNPEPNADELLDFCKMLFEHGRECERQGSPNWPITETFKPYQDLLALIQARDRTRALAILRELEEAGPQDETITLTGYRGSDAYKMAKNESNREWRTAIARLKDKYGGQDADAVIYTKDPNDVLGVTLDGKPIPYKVNPEEVEDESK